MNDNATGCELIPRRSSPILRIAALIVILGVSAGLRFYGSPLYHPDEHYVVVQAYYMPQTKFKPTNFNYPSFYPNLLAVVYKYAPAMGKGIIKKICPSDAIGNHPFYQIQARLITALLGTLTVFIVYLTGIALGWPYAGLAGAAFLAVSLNHVENSHFATVDAPMTFNAALAFLFSCLHYRSSRRLWAFLGGAFCGITIGTKYNAVPILIPFLFSMTCVAFRKRTLRAWWTVMGGMAAVPLGFLIANPYFITMPMSYINQLRIQMKVYSGRFPGYDDFTGPPNFIWNALYLARAGMGMLPTVLAMLGAIMLLVSQRGKGALIVCFPLFYYALISRQTIRVTRNLNVLTPFLALIAGYALCRIALFMLNRLQKRRLAAAAAIGAFTIAALWHPWCMSYRYARMMGRIDPRTLAVEWAKSNIPKGSKIAMDFMYGPLFSNEAYRIFSWQLDQFPLSWFLDKNFDYVVTTSGYYMHWAPENNPKGAMLYQCLKNGFQDVAVFAGNDLGIDQCYYAVSTRPTITVYDLHKPRYSAASVINPRDGSSATRSSCEIRWSFTDGDSANRQKAYRLQVERRLGDTRVIEAEALLDKARSRARWERQVDFQECRGDGLLVSSINPTPLESSLNVEKAGDYSCWVRFNWQRHTTTKITIGAASKAPAGNGREQWQWELLGRFPLTAGENKITIEHSGARPAFFDSFVLSADPAFNPDKDPFWAPAIDTGEVASAETYVPPSRLGTLTPGTYRTRVMAESATGRWGRWSPYAEFTLHN